MINEPEKRNLTAARLKFIAVCLIILGTGSFMLHYVTCLQVQFKMIEERLIQIL